MGRAVNLSVAGVSLAAFALSWVGVRALDGQVAAAPPAVPAGQETAAAPELGAGVTLVPAPQPTLRPVTRRSRAS